MSETRPAKSREAFRNILPSATRPPRRGSSQSGHTGARTRFVAGLTKEQHRALRQLALDQDLDASAIIRGALVAMTTDPTVQAKVLDAAISEAW
ncbi:MAG: hypothetical protein ACR2NJ_12955 [Acidimicrobiales bacterium]